MKRINDLKTSHTDVRLSRTREEELERRRREWAIEQERAREHERRKRKMIQDYEQRRARELEIKNRNRRSSRRSKSKSRSSSVNSPAKSHKSDSSPSKALVMSERFDAGASNTRLFKGPEGTKISVIELKKIKVDIHRNISTTEKTIALNRDIVNPEEVKLKRREGEGIKPIFEREELKKSDTQLPEIEERRTVVAIDTATTSHSSRKRSASASPRRHRSRSPRRESRYETTTRNHGEKDHHESSKYNRQHSSDRSRQHRDRHLMESHSTRKSSRDRSRDHRRHRSQSMERDTRYRSTRDCAAYEHDRHESRSRRYEDERARNRRAPLPHPYIEPMPVPFYYSNFARPIMVDPMMAMRGGIPLVRGRMPPMMGAVRPPFAPRFMPHEMFRPGGPQNPRFGRMM